MKTNKRNFFQTAGLGIASALPLTSCVTTVKAESETDEQVLLGGNDIAIAPAVYGKVQGFILRGIFNFRGIHKAVPLSGLTTKALDQEYSQKLGEYILKEAGLKPSEIDKLLEIPWKDYILLANNANPPKFMMPTQKIPHIKSLSKF